jgi:hypothetical protein
LRVAAGAGVEEDDLIVVVDDGVASCAILLKSKRIVVDDGGIASCGGADELHRELRSGGKKIIEDSGAAGRAGEENHSTTIVVDGSAAGRAGEEAHNRTADVCDVGGSAIQDDAGARKVDTPGGGGVNGKIVARRPRIKCSALDVAGGGRERHIGLVGHSEDRCPGRDRRRGPVGASVEITCSVEIPGRVLGVRGNGGKRQAGEQRCNAQPPAWPAQCDCRKSVIRRVQTCGLRSSAARWSQRQRERM